MYCNPLKLLVTIFLRLKLGVPGSGGCGRLLPVEYRLQARPARVFTLQLGWQKEQEDSQDILDTLMTISEVLNSAKSQPPPSSSIPPDLTQ